MTYTMQDFQRDYAKKYFSQLTVEEKKEVLRGLSAQELETLIQVVPLEVRLAGLTPEEIMAGLTPEERLAGLSEEQIRRYLDSRSANRREAKRTLKRK